MDNMGLIQLKLFDFCDEKIDFKEKCEEKIFKNSTIKNTAKNIQMLKDKYFQMINPICPDCGESNYTKQGFYEVNPKFENNEKIKIWLQRYYCKKCNKKFSTNLGSIKEKFKTFFAPIKEKVRQTKLNRRGSLRGIQKDFKIFLGLDISHQTVKNYLKIDEKEIIKTKNRIQRRIDKLSGYYVVDEQFIRRRPKKKYRVTMYDVFVKGPIAEEIMEERTKKNLQDFIETVTKGQDRISITTDGLSSYATIADDLGFIHQRCIFHLFKDVQKTVMDELKKNKYDKVTIMETFRNLTELKNVFRTYDEKTCLERFETLLDNSNTFIDVLANYIHDKLVPDFLRFSQFTRDNFIPRTSNQAEQGYSSSDANETKARYKTDEGLLEYLALNMCKNPLEPKLQNI
jgi:transposase-like protein